jgi:transcriptional regulator with XRE-family HTH domain
MNRENNNLKILGSKIKSIRENLGLSQELFAKQCGLTKNYIGMLERGERNPSYLTLLKIAKGHNIPLNQII